MNNNFEVLKTNGLSIPVELFDKLSRFSELVLQYNEKVNLISKGDEQKIFKRHIIDSLQPFRLYPLIFKTRPSTWVDIGSGAGFPVIPLAIVMGDIHFFAVEPRMKRATFLKLVAEKVGINNLTVICNDAEHCGLKNMDVVSCRALGSHDDDYQRANLLCGSNGVFITLKSFSDCQKLNQPPWVLHPYHLPEEKQDYCLLVRHTNYG